MFHVTLPRRAPALIFLAMAAVGCGDRGDGPGGNAAAEPTRLAAGPVVAPSPTPPPWLEGTLALAARDGQGLSVALVDVAAAARAVRASGAGAGGAGDDGGAPRVLAGGFESIEGLAWSPAGDSLAVAGRRGGTQDLWLVDASTGSLRRLTDDAAWDGRPAWSPDGQTLAFERHDEGGWGVFVAAIDGGEPEAPDRLTPPGLSAMEPAWSADGTSLVFAAWSDGAMALHEVGAGGGEPVLVAVAGAGAIDLRSPAISPRGDSLAWLRRRHGASQLHASPWPAIRTEIAGAATLAARASAYAWSPRGDAVAVLAAERSTHVLELRAVDGVERRVLGVLPAAEPVLAWSAATPFPPGARLLGSGIQEPERRFPGLARPQALSSDAQRPGLVRLAIDAPGPRMHADLVDDFEALRADVRAAVGVDFLARVSDMWRPLGFSSQGSAFYSWHKTGRAFDTLMELHGPGGRRDMLLLRDEERGRTYWRMLLRAGTQEGSVGIPLRETAWRFAVAADSEAVRREGGERGRSLNGGYWVDFTELAARHGWHRIPSIQRGGFDWREDWAAIEFWHYERRDGLRWSDAVRQVYTDAEIDEALDPESLRRRGITARGPFGRWRP